MWGMTHWHLLQISIVIYRVIGHILALFKTVPTNHPVSNFLEGRPIPFLNIRVQVSRYFWLKNKNLISHTQSHSWATFKTSSNFKFKSRNQIHLFEFKFRAYGMHALSQYNFDNAQNFANCYLANSFICTPLFYVVVWNLLQSKILKKDTMFVLETQNNFVRGLDTLCDGRWSIYTSVFLCQLWNVPQSVFVPKGELFFGWFGEVSHGV